MISNYATGYTLPKQMLSFQGKTKAWREQCVEAICGMSSYVTTNGRSSSESKQANYDLVSSILNEEDLRYVMDPYGLGDKMIGEQPAKMRDINIIVNKINKLKGEEMSRPFNPMVISVNGNAVSEKAEQKKEAMLNLAYSKLATELGISETVTDPQTGEQTRPQEFSDIDRYYKKSHRDIREEWGGHMYEYIKYHQNLNFKFNQGFEHALIVAEEIYHVGIVNNEVTCRTVNPINFEYDRNIDSDRIEDGDWMKEERYMTRGQILDEYGDYLTETQIRKLDNGDYRASIDQGMQPGFLYNAADVRHYSRPSQTTNNSHILVTATCWKSMKKIGFLSYTDEDGKPQTGIVDERFQMTDAFKEAGFTVEWKWIPEWWEGTKIGEEFYVNIRVVPNQVRSMDNPSYVPAPYVGRVYNSTNTQQTSLVDLIKPHQHLLNITWYSLEREMAKAKGKKFIMDMAMLPKSKGVNMDQWMYYFDSVGVAFINSMEEGSGSQAGKTSNFNQLSAIDMTLSQSIGQYISIIAKIEQTVDRMVGINAQREGDVQQRETSSGIEQAITMSSHITEPYFYMHNDLKKDVAQRVIEMSKFAYEDSKKIEYITNDVERISMEVDMDKFSDSDYGVFVSNSTKDHNTLMKLENLASQAIASGAASFSDLIKVFNSTSVSELSGIIKESEENKQAQEQQASQMNAQMEQQKLQADAIEKEKAREFDAEQNYLDRQNKIQVASINNIGFDQDIQGNQQIDAVRQGELFLKETESERKNTLEKDKINRDSSLKNRELDLKEKEIQSRERIEKLKAKTAIKNKVPGEK